MANYDWRQYADPSEYSSPGYSSSTPISSSSSSAQSGSSGGLGSILGDIGKGFLTGAASGFLKQAGGGEAQPTSSKKGEDPGAALARAFLEKEIRDRLSLTSAAEKGASAFL
jgi:hypothetical protein